MGLTGRALGVVCGMEQSELPGPRRRESPCDTASAANTDVSTIVTSKRAASEAHTPSVATTVSPAVTSKMAAKRPRKASSTAASVALENTVSGMRRKAVASVVSSVPIAVVSEKAVKRPRKSATDATVASASSKGAARISAMPSHAALTHGNESTACESACLHVSFLLIIERVAIVSSYIYAGSYRSSVVGEVSATAESMAECHGVR